MSATASAPEFDAAVLIGRLQPVHLAHVALLHHALERAATVVVVLGSAFQGRSTKNPFTWQERERMLREALSPQDSARLKIVPMRDYYDEPRWVRAVQEGVHAAVPAARRIALVGHFKDSSSSYLQRFPGWQLLDMPRLGDIDATPIRDAYWRAGTRAAVAAALQDAQGQLPPASLAFLIRFADTPEYPRLSAEWHYLRDYRAAWAVAPYAPTFVTVDALVLCQGHVLLVQRGQAPGQGQWALPGGFVERNDTLWQSCLRELDEETGLRLPPERWKATLQGVEVFDHPHRSERGRTITHVHVLDLGDDSELPDVQGGDDAAAAVWHPLDSLASLEPQCFEDHFHVLRRCFERFGPQLRTAVPSLP